MPSSSPEAIPVIIGLIWHLAPKRVLDVGAGYGKYGMLFREYLEMLHTQSDKPRPRGTTIWKNRVVHIDAVEGFEDYVGDFHRLVYDNVYIENILDFIKKRWEYDVVFMGDLLEHIEKQVAIKELLPVLVRRAKMGVVVSVPTDPAVQAAEFGNKLEVHRSEWHPRDFRGIAPFVRTGLKGNHLISFLTKEVKYYRIVRGNVFRHKARAMKRAVLDSW